MSDDILPGGQSAGARAAKVQEPLGFFWGFFFPVAFLLSAVAIVCGVGFFGYQLVTGGLRSDHDSNVQSDNSARCAELQKAYEQEVSGEVDPGFGGAVSIGVEANDLDCPTLTAP